MTSGMGRYGMQGEEGGEVTESRTLVAECFHIILCDEDLFHTKQN